MLQEQVIPINFGQGVDTKTDPKAVVAGKFLRLENGVFTAPNRIAKRNGYTALSSTISGVGSLVAPSMVRDYNNELIAADQNLLLSYSKSGSNWLSRGSYTSTEITRQSIDQSHVASGCSDSAILNNYILYAWSTVYQDNASYPLVYSSVYASIVDNQTGATVVGPQLLATYSGSGINPVKCVLLGGTVLAVLYGNTGSTAIVSRTVSFSGGAATFSGENTVSTNYLGNASSKNFDIESTSTGAALLYVNTAGITLTLLNTSGTIASTTTFGTNDDFAALEVSVNATNGNIWVYYQQTSTHKIIVRVFSSSLAVVLGATVLVTLAAPNNTVNLVAVFNSTTQQTVYYGILVATGTASGNYIDSTYYITITSAGVVGSSLLFANGVAPYSKSFRVVSSSITNDYAVFIYRGAFVIISGGVPTTQAQPTFFVIQLAAPVTGYAPLVVGRFASGVANSLNITNPVNQVLHYKPQMPFISATKIVFSCGITLQEFSSDYFVSVELTSGGSVGAFSYFLDFNSTNTYRSVISGDLAVLNGGLTQVYDGNRCAEFGFHLFPEITATDPTNSGAMAAGTYSYIAIFQWTDAQGNLHQSAPSNPVTGTVDGMTTNAINVYVTTPYLTQKTGVSVAIYRTVASGTVYHLVSDPIFLKMVDPTTAVQVIFTDRLADASIAGNPLAYTYPASSVLENDTPPPSIIMVSHNNRLWFVDSENPNTTWYTKSFSPGTGLSPSGFMTQQLDPKFGNISALAEMDDKLVTFKTQGIFIQAGDGVNDTGNGSTLSFPQVVPSDVGVSQFKSVITTPSGVMFKSPNGVYMLTRATQVVYIGAEVESYNSQVVTAANLVPGKSQIRFLCSTGLALVYDYIFNQWSTFTNHTGLSSSTWNNSYVYSNGSVILQETAGTYADNGSAFALLAQTSWLALASIQGFQRVKRLIMLGDFINGNSASHNLSIAAAYDFSTTFQTAITYAFGATSASGVFQYRERLPIQKCDAISLLIQETTTGSSAEYIDLTNISFEAGVKRGANKLSGAQSVG